jgi:hypothetical protein
MMLEVENGRATDRLYPPFLSKVIYLNFATLNYMRDPNDSFTYLLFT